jgi:hypothetical protein
MMHDSSLLLFTRYKHQDRFLYPIPQPIGKKLCTQGQSASREDGVSVVKAPQGFKNIYQKAPLSGISLHPSLIVVGMKTLFANIVNSGTQKSHSPKENQTARLINRVALIFIFAVLPNAVFMSFL